MRDALTWGTLGDPEVRALVEPLRHETRRFFLLIATLGYTAWHTPNVLLRPAEESLPHWTLFAVVATVLAAAVLLDQLRSWLATPVLLAGGIVAIVAAIAILESSIPLLILPLLTLATVALLTPLAALFVAAGATGLLVVLSTAGYLPVLSERQIVETAAATLLTAATAWTLGRNLSIAAGWALSSYEQARRRTDDAQHHRAELVQALKQLDDAYWRLEQLNLELERARRAAHDARRLKEQFAVAVSHELRTPLNLILGFCEMMVMAPTSAYGQKLPATYRGDIEAMYRNASHLSELVDDILDLSQIDANRMALHRTWSALPEIVAEAVATVETLYINRDLSLRAMLPPDLPLVFVDRTRIRQILINLLSNAARFVQEGGVTVDARAEDQALVMMVRDTGPGILTEDLPYVFQEFRQSSDPARRRSGSGLGLAVSKRFAELHGGDLTVESAEGVGATFHLHLPTSPDAPPINPHAPLWEGPLASRVRGQLRHRIAVADERGEILGIFRRYLDDYDVIGVDVVEESIRHKRPEPIQAVVVGSPAAADRWQTVCRSAAYLSELPQITCTFRTTRATAEEIGADAYITKPVRRDQLRRALRLLGREVRTALVVDDDPGTTRLLGRMVRTIIPHCTVPIANDGETALRLARERRPDVILLDLLMPGLDGYAVLTALRADEALRSTPVVVISARGVHDESIVATALGVSRDGGLTVGEAMQWIKAGLTALRAPDTTAPAPTATMPP